MNLVYLSESQLPSTRANAVHVMRMVESLSGLGHQTTLFGQTGDETLGDIYSYYGVTSPFPIKLFERPQIAGFGAARLAQLMAIQLRAMPKPDALYGRNLLALSACVEMGIPFAFEAHALPRTAIHTWILRWLLLRTNCKGLVVISDGLRKDYQLHFGDLLNRINVTILHDAASDPTGTPILPIKWEGREGCLQAGYVGSLYPGKGAELVVRLAELMPNVDFHIVGGQPDEVLALSEQKNAQNLFFHGHQPPVNLPAFYKKFDVTLAPLERRVTLEGGRGDIVRWTSPLKIFEYMSHRKATISSDLPTLREILSHEQTALFCNPGNLGEWVNAINRLHDEKFRYNLGNAAYNHFRENFTWDARARSVTEILST